MDTTGSRRPSAIWTALFGFLTAMFITYGVVTGFTYSLYQWRISPGLITYMFRLVIVAVVTINVWMKKTSSVISSSIFLGWTVLDILIAVVSMGTYVIRRNLIYFVFALVFAVLLLLAALTRKRKLCALLSLAVGVVAFVIGFVMSMFGYKSDFIGLSAWINAAQQGVTGFFSMMNYVRTSNTMLTRYFAMYVSEMFFMLAAGFMASGMDSERRKAQSPATSVAVIGGEPVARNVPGESGVVKSKVAAALLAGLIGNTGAHRYYLGYKAQGAVQTCGFVVMVLGYVMYIPAIIEEELGLLLFAAVLLLAGAGIGIWAFVDFIRILTGNLKPLGGVYESGARPAPAYVPQTAPAQPVNAPVQPAMPQPEAPKSASEDPLAVLQRLSALRDAGILSEEEFSEKKLEILSKL